MRDKWADHYEVLEKIKEFLIMPGTDCMTVKQIAEYYEVGKEAVQSLYKDNRKELDDDGVVVKSYKEFLNVPQGQLKTGRGVSTLLMDNGDVFTVPNRGLKLFPRRAVLRIGMLLQQSVIAKEVRTQLLNIEEKTSNEIKTQDINEEQKLAMELGMSIASGNAEAITMATGKMIAFKNRHIAKLPQDNKALAGEILEWRDRNKLNAGTRKLSATTGIPFANMWNELYKNLQYKYGINLKQRGNKPYVQWVKESEWNKVVKIFCAMSEAYGKSPTEMFQQSTPHINP